MFWKNQQRSIFGHPNWHRFRGQVLSFLAMAESRVRQQPVSARPLVHRIQKSYSVFFCKFQSNMSQKSSQLLQLVNSMNRVEWRFSNLHFQKIFRTLHHLGITPEAETQSQPHPHDWLRYQMNVFRGRWPRCCTFGLENCYPY